MRPDLEELVPLALDHPEWEVRWNAIQGLVKLADPRGRDALIATARDRSRQALQNRREAVDALGKLKDERAIDPLVELLDDPDLRSSAARALATIGHLRCVEPLIRVLEGEHPLDAWELRSIKEEAAARLLVAALRRALPVDREHFVDRQGQIGEVLITALGNLRDPSAVPAIAEWGIWTRVYEVSRPPSYYLPSDDPDLQPIDQGPHDPYPLETAWIGALRRIGGPEATAALGERGHHSTGRAGRWLP